jgi:hypothetical protein
MTTTPADPVGALLAVGCAFKGLTEVGADNHGQVVEWFLKSCDLGPGFPWCCAFVSFVGRAALTDPVTGVSAWPLPMTASCAALGAFALRKGVLVDTPERGDIGLIWYPKLGRFGHAVILLDTPANLVGPTVEGNTSGGGSREGWGCFTRVRHFAARDRFVRWTKLLPVVPGGQVLAPA